MIGSGVSTDSMMAASFGIIDSITLTTSTMSSLSATSAFHGGGVGVLGRVGVGATRTAITAVTTTAATVPLMDTAIAVDLEWLNYRAGSLARAITMALSTESWDLRLGEQYGPTSATTDTWADSAAGYSLLHIRVRTFATLGDKAVDLRSDNGQRH